MPAPGRGDGVLGIFDQLLTLGEDLFVDGEDGVLPVISEGSCYAHETMYRCMRNEVGDGQQGSIVSIDKSFVPGELFLVLDLDDTGERDFTVWLDKVFQASRNAVIRSIQSLFGFLDSLEYWEHVGLGII